MRLILTGLFLVIFFILSIPVFLIEFILEKYNRRAMAVSSQAIVSAAFRIVLFISGVKRTVIGRDNIPKNEAVLYVANHRSYFDVPVTYVSLPNLTGFMAKKEIAKIPFLRTWMRFIQCLFLDRDDIKQGLKTVLQGIEQIKSGYSVFISPEGTRNQSNEMLPFKEGSFKMAEKTGCAIIPVAISNTDALFEKQTPWIRSAHVIVEFGKPIYPNQLDKEERKFLGSYVQNIIKEALDKNSKLI
ncbi:1-acyl-sn-glycerol-3-phosphate acyltransferase [Mobilitalea sibirica]|uniref:1-acyl-sn-glycerol-3-phosphate acyltransferase n=1 Tax=Mobilitalea sibirica TaxID=1462919 RepID=A0A8J7KXQ2_9FIRM|nr:lysophospholipid acyltransferase family protein [Mobilitalea sibirica]MBH1942072.1 1-acyl-sn-glycerol-3-phosphate acyltransferase [Mobilitalea sibirica]